MTVRRVSGISRPLAAAGLGLIVSWACFAHFIAPSLRGPAAQVLAVVTLGSVFSLAADRVLSRFLWPRLAKRPHAANLTRVLAAVGASVLLVALIPIPAPLYPWSPIQRLEIVATGQRNPAARRSEVWVHGLIRPGGSPVALREFVLEGDWEVRDGIPVSYRRQPATLRWEGRLTGDAQLRLASHPWSGIVDIMWNGNVQTVDLYAHRAVNKRIFLPVPDIPRAAAALYGWLGWGADAVSLGLFMLAGSVWLASRRSGRAITEHIRRIWLRPTVSVCILIAATRLAPRTGFFGWPNYWRLVTAPREVRHGRLELYRDGRAFLQAHLPAGATVLTDQDTNRWLTMLHDGCVVVPAVGSLAVNSQPERLAARETLLAEETPWELRHEILEKYGIEWVLFAKERVDQSDWVREHARGTWNWGELSLVRLQTD